MVAAWCRQTARLLIVENGVYGERIAQICAQYRDRARAGDAATGCRRPIWPRIAQRLDAAARWRRAFTHVAVVHHETTTGRLNDLAPLGATVPRSTACSCWSMASAVSAPRRSTSRDQSLAAVAATANKCLHGVPGVASSSCAARALARRCQPHLLPRSWRRGRCRISAIRPSHRPCMRIMRCVEALREFAEQGGRPARYRRYAALAEQVRAGLAHSASTR